ncbi:CbtA family protein [Gordonia polyisoprenivorans]|uniref:CbtA family protein n=1 Tax=Gordonia polyisoprenivorans TaxID=84595 RepID=UPI0030CC86FD
MKTTYVGPGLIGGLVAGLAAFAYARVFTEPLVAQAIDFESDRSEVQAHMTGGHDHEHEVFTRTIQENVGAGVGTVVFAIAMGGFFVVAFTLLRTALARQNRAGDPRVLGGVLALVMFVAIYLGPALIYPPNPPSVGDPDTIGERSGAYLTVVLVSVMVAGLGLATYLLIAERIGGLYAGIVACVGYVAVLGVTAVMMPHFDEVPTPLEHDGHMVAAGFPASVLAEFRIASVGGQLVLWTVLAVVFAVVVDRMMRREAAPAALPAEMSMS